MSALIQAVDVPREEGRPGPARLEAPLGPLNASWQAGVEEVAEVGKSSWSQDQQHCTYASGRPQMWRMTHNIPARECKVKFHIDGVSEATFLETAARITGFILSGDAGSLAFAMFEG